MPRGRPRSDNPSAAALKQRERYAKNPDQIKKNNEKIKEKKYSSLDAYILAQHNNSNRKKYLTKEELLRKWHYHLARYGPYCSKTGVKFIIDHGHPNHPRSPSLDQIIPGLGYLHWNIQFTTLAYNKARSNFGDDEMIRMAHGIIAHADDTTEVAVKLIAMSNGLL